MRDLQAVEREATYIPTTGVTSSESIRQRQIGLLTWMRLTLLKGLEFGSRLVEDERLI